MGWLTVNSSVGASNASNKKKDVKLVQALLNIYLRNKKKTTLKITGKINKDTNQAILELQKTKFKKKKYDGRVDPRGDLYKVLIKIRKNSFSRRAITQPIYGIVTWNSEGSEGGRFHSRRLHVPNGNSGLTLGRGYDCKQKKQSKLSKELVAAGVKAKYVSILKKSSGLKGNKARQFIIDNDLLDYEITPAVQKSLFKTSYDEEAKIVKDISERKNIEKAYGETEWKTLNKYIKDIAIDLKFRGDYHKDSRKFIQKPIADNDLAAFTKQISNKSNWSNVPKDRFERRKNYLAKVTPKKSSIKKSTAKKVNSKKPQAVTP